MKKLLFIILLLIGCSEQPIDEILGCTDESSTNYDPSANVNDKSCGGVFCEAQLVLLAGTHTLYYSVTDSILYYGLWDSFSSCREQCIFPYTIIALQWDPDNEGLKDTVEISGVCKPFSGYGNP